MKIAFVYDRVNKWGGAERVLLALHEIWPEAPLYTAVYDKNRARWADVFNVHPSFLGNLPHEFLPWITPLAFETFSFDDYDVVISVTSAEAKGIITKPKTLHICYCLTPTRYLWSSATEYQSQGFMGMGLRLLSPTLKRWDKIASSRPDHYIAISQTVKDRIRKYYERDAFVLYPPVDIEKFRFESIGDYFLVVSRLVGYKRIDLIIEAFNDLGWPLIIIGDGLQKVELKQKAKSNIQFIDRYLTDRDLATYYGNCRALIHAAQEDFGIVAVEALSAGKPVITFTQSGVSEIIESEKIGLFFEEQSKRAIINALKEFEKKRFDPVVCKRSAVRFSKERFINKFKETIHNLI